MNEQAIEETSRAIREQALQAVAYVEEFAATLAAASTADEAAEVARRFGGIARQWGEQYVSLPYASVVRAWDDGRRRDGLRNPTDIERRDAWWLAERVLDRAGEPLGLADLDALVKAAGPGAKLGYRSVSPKEVALLFARLANANIGRLAPAKGNLPNGKVAYLLVETATRPEEINPNRYRNTLWPYDTDGWLPVAKAATA